MSTGKTTLEPLCNINTVYSYIISVVRPTAFFVTLPLPPFFEKLLSDYAFLNSQFNQPTPIASEEAKLRVVVHYSSLVIKVSCHNRQKLLDHVTACIPYTAANILYYLLTSPPR